MCGSVTFVATVGCNPRFFDLGTGPTVRVRHVICRVVWETYEFTYSYTAFDKGHLFYVSLLPQTFLCCVLYPMGVVTRRTGIYVQVLTRLSNYKKKKTHTRKGAVCTIYFCVHVAVGQCATLRTPWCTVLSCTRRVSSRAYINKFCSYFVLFLSLRFRNKNDGCYYYYFWLQRTSVLFFTVYDSATVLDQVPRSVTHVNCRINRFKWNVTFFFKTNG